MPVIQAQDIVNAVIQDAQVQTTNRAALYDYTDRVHQRILRESQWRFLLSDPQYFVTLPGVGSYTLVNTPVPTGSFLTNLNLTNFANIAPGTVFDLTTGTKLEEDSETQTTTTGMINRDGSLRSGIPRTYSNSIYSNGTITLKPVPDGANLYYPIPETPYVTYAPLSGCTLPNRIYFGVVTFVDSFGGESLPCNIPFTIAVPAGSTITVSSPVPPDGLIGGNQIAYSSWNLYIGYSVSNYIKQNAAPISIGTSWSESVVGIGQGNFSLPSLLNAPFNSTIAITNGGLLISNYDVLANPPSPWALIDSTGGWWEVEVSTSYPYPIITVSIAPNTPGVTGLNYILLNDTSAAHTWSITVLPTGQLMSTITSTPPLANLYGPPQTSTIQPLSAYVIQFRYYMTRNQIVNPTDVLQIPYAYKDIVIAGVNYLSNLYVDQRTNGGLSERTTEWKRTFEQGLSQIRRDLRVSFRKTDFIAPDVATQQIISNLQGIPTLGW